MLEETVLYDNSINSIEALKILTAIELGNIEIANEALT